MAWPNIDPTVPLGTEKKKFGDDRIREAKQHLVDGLQAISNYAPAGGQPALRTAVWTTATRPTGANLVDRVSGYNSDLGVFEYYDLSTTTWKTVNRQAISSWTVAGRPATPYIGQYGHNTDLAVIERWSGSAWVRVSGGRRGDIKMWSGATSDIETGWCLCDGVQRAHPEGGNFTPPDLRNKFIVGAGQDGGIYTPGVDGIGSGYYAPGATGGEDKHKLTVAELAAHTHVMYKGGDWQWQGTYITPCGSVASAINTGSTGNDTAHENRPPFYALCFLYKL